MDSIYVNIKKPIYANYVGIRDKYIYQALREHKQLRIETPNGTTTISPKEILKKGDIIEKEFLIPGHPMKLYCMNLKLDKVKEERPKVEYHIVEDHTIPFDVLEKLRDRAKQLKLI